MVTGLEVSNEARAAGSTETFSDTFEPSVINGHLLNQFLFDSKIQLLKFVGEVIAVDQIDGRSPVPRASLTAAGVKVPVVMNNPLSAEPRVVHGCHLHPRMVQQFDRGAGQGCWPDVSVAGHWQNGPIGGTHVAVNRRWE